MDPVTGAVVIAGLQKFGEPTSELVKDFLSRILSPTGDALGSGLALFDTLHSRGILIRDLASSPGLADCLRITVGTRAQNDRFIATLTEVA